jgi:hypothetical protein
MAFVVGILNRLLPFATPGTPLVQDLVHLGAICTVLYFAPQIQQWIQTRQSGVDGVNGDPAQPIDIPPNAQPNVVGDIPERQDDEQHEAQPDANPDDHINEVVAQAPDFGEPQEGQAGLEGPVANANHRNVGAKKAKALARKDQKRAYNEFMRSQGDAQRAKDAEGAAEREAALAAERERRRATEVALETRRTKEREQKRDAERREREEEFRRRDLVVKLVREALEENSMCDLFKVARQVGGDADEEWVEKIMNASGLLGTRDGVMTMVTSMGWAVKLRGGDVQKMYQNAMDGDAESADGSVSYESLGGMLEAVLNEKSAG